MKSMFSLAAAAGLAIAVPASAQLVVTSTSPAINASNVARNTALSVTFNQAVDQSTFVGNNFHGIAKWSGPIEGPITFSPDGRTVTLTPTHAFAAGESAMLVMSHNLRAANGQALRSAGYTVTFTTRSGNGNGNGGSAPSHRRFKHVATVNSRDDSGAQTRIYGGLACDLNRDGWSDLTLINEVSADVRVFLNRADGSGLVQSMLPNPTPIPGESSPNDVADFNGDGFVDLVTSSDGENKLAIALGNGDGTFQIPTLFDMGGNPRGIGTLDVDGDGDIDIVVAQADGNNIAFLRNNGSGVFAAPTTFEGGVNGEYGLAVADMNNDGILDIVVGGRNSQTVSVLRGNGNGTFTLVSTRSLGGANWVIVCADLNHDGFMDVSTANSSSGTASVLLGNGNGTLRAPQIVTTGGSNVSTDLADVDGDGDLDWIVSNFATGRWYLYLNDGTGNMVFDREYIAPANPSCCLPADFNNDGFVDLAFTDEIADVVVMMRSVCAADFNDDGATNADDISDFITCFFDTPACLTADFNEDGVVNSDDLSDYITEFFSSDC